MGICAIFPNLNRLLAPADRVPSLFAATATKSPLIATFPLSCTTDPPFLWSSSRTMSAWWQQIHALGIFTTLTGRDIRLGVVRSVEIWRVYCVAICFPISHEGVERGCECLWVLFAIETDSNSMAAWQTGTLPTPASARTIGNHYDVIPRCFKRKHLVNIVICRDNTIAPCPKIQGALDSLCRGRYK